MVFAIDLTTIATTENSGGYARFLNREFELGIEEADLARADTFRDFASLPQARRFFERAKCEPALSQQIEEIIDGVDPLHPIMLQALLPRAGAVAGVRSLADDQPIIYVTRRPHSCAQITQAWLQQHGFPACDSIYYCQNEAEKWLHALHEATENEAMVLIDCQVAGLIAGYRQFCQSLPDQARRLQGRSALFAFGWTQFPPSVSPPFPLYPCPDWSAIATGRAISTI